MPKPRNRKRNQRLIFGGVMAAVAVGVAAVAVSVLNEPPTDPEPEVIAEAAPPVDPAPVPEPTAESQPRVELEPTGPPLVADNGRTLWVSPTAGEPMLLAFLPPDCQLFLRLRPAELLASRQASLALTAAGPAAKRLIETAEELIGVPLEEMQTLTVGVRPGVGQSLETTLVVELTREAPSRLGREAEHAGWKYKMVGDWCYFTAPDDERKLVVAKRPAMHEILDTGGGPLPLRREMEQLLNASDADRHASLLVSPSFLFTEGRSLFAGDVEALKAPLFEEVPDDLRAALVGFHWPNEVGSSDGGDRFYWEIKAAPAADITAKRLSVTLDQRVARWPSEVQLAMLNTNPAEHGKRVVAQLPLMLGVATKLTRAGVERRHAVLNGYLPAPAGHNLLLAAELLLAQQSAVGAAVGGSAAANVNRPSAPQTAAERLQTNATVSFARDTLEMAVQYLSDEIDVPIVIVGGDLQLEGITKNQSFGLDLQNQPAEKVLLEILARANPDKTAAGPTDPKQKLVYVIRREGERETIYVTTRSAAEKRGEALPRVFNR